MELKHFVVRAFTPPDEINCLLGEAPPVLSGGYGGMETVRRPGRPGMTLWRGRDPFTLKVELVFDDFKDNQSVEGKCNKIHRWATSSAPFSGPRGVKPISPAIDVPDVIWQIKDIEWGEAIRAPQLQYRTRQLLAVTFQEFVPPQVVGERRDHKIGESKYRMVTARAGDTYSKIAQRELHNWHRWKEIAKLNNDRTNHVLKAGRRVRVPRGG